MNARITQTDVARRLGVHPTTVSLALRNSPSISQAMRQRIREVADEMGYHPDPALSALMAYRSRRMTRRSQVVAYVTHWSTRWGWQEMPAHAKFYTGAVRKGQELGYEIEHFWLGEPDMNARRLSDILFHRNISGVILASHRPESDGMAEFDWSRVSAVKIDHSPHRPALHRVTNHQSAQIRMVVQQARAAGYRRIGFVMTHAWDNYVDAAWSAGFLAEQSRWPELIPLPIHWSPDQWPIKRLEDGGDNEEPGTAAFLRWFWTHRPEVIISRRPITQRVLESEGLQVPRDVAYIDLLVDSDDNEIAGVRQNCERVGEVAVEMLSTQLQQNAVGIPSVPTVTLVEGSWVPGRSLPVREPDGTWPQPDRVLPHGTTGERAEIVA